jgi:hypothetical protein
LLDQSRDEYAVLYAVAGFYAAASILVCVCVILHVATMRKAWQNAVFWLMIWFLVTVVMRCVYLFLVGSSTLESSSSLLSFWLVNFPLVTYLVGNLAIGLSFLFLLLRHTYTVLHRPLVFQVTYAVASGVLFAWFLLIMMLFEFLALRGDNSTDYCAVQLGETNAEQRNNIAYALRITYQSVVGFVALVIGSMELVLGTFLSRKSTRKSSKFLLVMAVVSSLGVLCDSIAWVVYTVVDRPSPYFSVVLLLTEVVPICLVTGMVAVSVYRSGASTQSVPDELNSYISSTNGVQARSIERTLSLTNSSMEDSIDSY